MHLLVADRDIDAEAGAADMALIIVVELHGDVAGQFQMLLLVVADRHMRAAIDEDVGGHQAGIGEQAERGILAVLAGLVLELGHAVHPADAGDAIEHPGELRMLRHGRLVEDDVLFGIDARGDEGGGNRADLAAQIVMHQLRGQRMQVDDAIDAVIAILQRDELADRAEIIAEMQIAGRLDAGKHEFLEFGHDVLVGSNAHCSGLVEGPKGSMSPMLLTVRLMHGSGGGIKGDWMQAFTRSRHPRS